MAYIDLKHLIKVNFFLCQVWNDDSLIYHRRQASTAAVQPLVHKYSADWNRRVINV